MAGDLQHVVQPLLAALSVKRDDRRQSTRSEPTVGFETLGRLRIGSRVKRSLRSHCIAHRFAAFSGAVLEDPREAL